MANWSNLSRVLLAYRPRRLPPIPLQGWLEARYKPTPTIVEAAKALYEGHRVEEISRSDAGAINLSKTAGAISAAIEHAKAHKRKTICFVTGVPGSGKTLAGLNLATSRMQTNEDEHAVFLSGNGPLVIVLREALARDEVARAKQAGKKLTKQDAKKKVFSFVQNIHHFRDDNLRSHLAPVERVVVFDEAQRAWTREKAASFMRERHQDLNFDMSEPEFLLSVMDRHADWCVVVCLIGGGQEINTGEAGLTEWFEALGRRYPHWRLLYSDQIKGEVYSWGSDLTSSISGMESTVTSDLHLSVNIRSFRAENVSAFVGALLEGDAPAARGFIGSLDRYPIVLTRDLQTARDWLRKQARGTERYGLAASSKAQRLKPHGIYVKAKIDPANWFLNDKGDVRASYALEDIASEFDIQGLELDWVGVCWDGNLRYIDDEWTLHTFRGNRWTNINDFHRRVYLKNAYRVLLTRARQGMVIWLPEGSQQDPTRPPEYYDGTFRFLQACGIPVLPQSG